MTRSRTAAPDDVAAPGHLTPPDDAARPDSRPGALTSVAARPALVLRNATIGYRGRPVVVAANLVVEHGEVLVLLGANGSGKTTLIRGLLGLADLLQGVLEVDGRPTAARTARGAVRLGYVPQRLSAAAGIPTTAAEIVATGLLAERFLWAAGKASRVRVHAALCDIGMSDLARTPMEELSGGQQRRVLIARALVSDPSIVILDEPTAGVDRAGIASLVATLAELKASGRTLLVATHERDAFGDLFDRTVTLADGRVRLGAPAPGAVTGGH